MDLMQVAVQHILGEYPLECMYCTRTLESRAFYLSEKSEHSKGLMILDICCSFCQQVGYLELRFPRFDLLDISGSFKLLTPREVNSRIGLPEYPEILLEVYVIL